ncbi:MAG TPA: phage portal protein [Butyricimonas virosa]|uniref:Phage portal protein n=1 Tax=Butyricimonas virosa TaxID=544645 RepID=A0A921KYQ4_9BACT|nr:phage portal protein [Butyricimonas virosa]
MIIIDFFNSSVNWFLNTFGAKRDLLELIKDKDINKAIQSFQCRDTDVEIAISELDPASHKVNRRPNKKRIGKPDKITAKLAIPCQRHINEVELAFLYGTMPTWNQTSINTDRAFEAFGNFLKNTRWGTTQREFKRTAGGETESAKLYYVYMDTETQKKKVGVKVLAKTKGDEIRPLFDQYGNMLAFGHGYYLKEGNTIVRHFDIYCPDYVFRCTQKNIGWDVITEKNDIGKIPVIYVQQPKAWDGVQALIDRLEELRSRVSDVNDYVADPILKMSTDIMIARNEAKINNSIKSGLPDPDTSGGGKAVGLPTKDSIMEYLTVDTAVDLKKNEIEDLDKVIKVMSMTPDLTFEALISAGAPTGRALRRAMALGYMKRAKNIEIYSIAQDREANLIKAIIGNVLDISLKSEMEKLIVHSEFGEPFQDDISEKISDIIKLRDAGLLSQETAMSLIDYIKDVQSEIDKIKTELEEKQQMLSEQMGAGSLFGQFRNNTEEE